MDEFERGMRAAGKLAARTLEHTVKFVKAGITTNELDLIADDFAKSHGGISAPLGYKGYPKATCISLNDVLCHGVPDDTKLKDGDILNIDVTVILNGYYGDTSATFGVGTISEAAQKLINAAQTTTMAGISMARPFGFTGDIGFASMNSAKSLGFYVADNIGGHGIGKKFHMEPHIPGKGAFGSGTMLIPGQCITVEPIVLERDVPFSTHIIPNSSICFYKTPDASLATQFEHTILITKTGRDILTLP